MARTKNLENMSYAELSAMQSRIERMKIEKQGAERVAVKQELMDIAKEAGFDIHDLIDGRKTARERSRPNIATALVIPGPAAGGCRAG
jgi:uncharacterized protein (UPF0335 family)